MFPEIVSSQDDVKTVNNYEIDDINIEFKGIKTFSEDDLKNILASSEGDVFDMLTYIQDTERIKKFYFDNGFFDAEVDTHIVYINEDLEVDLYFYIREKTRYVYYEFEYTGLEKLSEDNKGGRPRPAAARAIHRCCCCRAGLRSGLSTPPLLLLG